MNNLLIISLLALVSAALGASCILPTPDGRVLNAARLATEGGYKVSSADYQYYVNFCAPVNRACDQKGSEFKAIQADAHTTNCYYLSASTKDEDDTELSFNDPADPSKGATLRYLHGEQYQGGETYTRQTEIQLICGDKEELALAFVEETTVGKAAIYKFTATSSLLCLVGDAISKDLQGNYNVELKVPYYTFAEAGITCAFRACDVVTLPAAMRISNSSVQIVSFPYSNSSDPCFRPQNVLTLYNAYSSNGTISGGLSIEAFGFIFQSDFMHCLVLSQESRGSPQFRIAVELKRRACPSREVGCVVSEKETVSIIWGGAATKVTNSKQHSLAFGK